jgi:hypothetical protein
MEAHKLLNIKELIFKMGSAGSPRRGKPGYARFSQ